MSGSKVVDGKTGQLIGNYNPSGSYGNTATSTYVPAYTTYAYGSTSGADKAQSYPTQPTYQSGYTTSNYQPAYSSSAGNYNISGQNYNAGGVTSGSRTQAVSGQQGVSGQQWMGGQAEGTTVNMGKEVIKGESRIEYVPFEKKIVEYKDQTVVERVPKKTKKVEYRQERKIENIPKEVTVTDYYAIEYLRQYIPQIVSQKVTEYIQVPKKQIRYEYVPVERQIVHYPDQPLQAERVVSGSQVAGQTTKEGYMPGYVAGQSETSNVRTGYATSGQGYTSSQNTYNIGQNAYTSGGAYSTDKISSTPTLYTTGPTNEYMNAGSSNPYTNLEGQRWESTPSYTAERSQKR